MNDKTKCFNLDCLPAMREFPDKHFDLAIVDPPYGNDHDFGGRPSGKMYENGDQWNVKPPDEYFDELKRVSKNYIVWGGNYFPQLWPCKDFVIWDKRQPEGISFAMVELAATSFNGTAKLYFTKPAGERGFYTVDAKRIHPTQKPIKLYKWLLKNYAKEGDKILDSHCGSQSSRIAAYDMGFDYVGYEIDKDYFEAGNKRFEQHKSQLKLFV